MARAAWRKVRGGLAGLAYPAGAWVVLALAGVSAGVSAGCGLSADEGSCQSCDVDATTRGPDATGDVYLPPPVDSGATFFNDTGSVTDTGSTVIDSAQPPPFEAGMMDTGCASAASCPPGSACNPTTKACVGSCSGGASCNGCCDNAMNCQVGRASDACGGAGSACVSCTSMATNQACLGGTRCGCTSATDCQAGQVCTGGTCGPCSPTARCAGGCCAAGSCVAGTSDDQACGTFGAMCAMCMPTETCTGGICLCSTSCPAGTPCVSSGACASGTCMGGQCACSAGDPCYPGGVCQSNGQCDPLGQCSAGSCNGCCDTTGHCHANGEQSCGIGGGACQNCMMMTKTCGTDGGCQ